MAGALPTAWLVVLLTGAGLSGDATATASAGEPPNRPAVNVTDPFSDAASPSPLAGPRSAVGFQRALGVVGPALTSSHAGGDTAADRHVRAPDPWLRTLAAMTAAGDRIATRPYVYGGGHGSFTSAGYDCSGSVSYVLHAAGLLSIPDDSTGLESFGEAGPGRHVTIYANAQHALMTIDGRRFDTIAFQETGTRWSDSLGSTAGYVERHPAGM